MDNQNEPSAGASESDVVGRRDTPKPGQPLRPVASVGAAQEKFFDNSVDRKSCLALVDEPLREAGVVCRR